MPIRYHSQTVRKETLHNVSLVAPHLDRGMTVLDVGCGEGYVAQELGARGVRRLCKKNHVLYDIKHVFPAAAVDGRL